MSRYRVYIKPFQTEEEYQEDFIDVSSDVLNLDTISQSLDNSTYDIGIFKNSGLKLRFRNDHGKYSDPGAAKSIFNFRKQDSIVRITWSVQDLPIVAGFFTLNPMTIGEEVVIFEGLLSDLSGLSSIEDQYIDFRFSGYESLFDRVTVPFDLINNGDTFSQVIYNMLNQEEITRHLTLLPLNINCDVNLTIDDKSSLENKTVREALDSLNLLLASNSVLYIDNNILYVDSREAFPELEYSFYGQNSVNGIENIISIKDYRDGVNKIFNYASWPESSTVEINATSISTYGTRKIEVGTDLILGSSTAKVSSVLSAIRDEFALPKKELMLETPLNYKTLALSLKDRVNIDYPTVYTPADDNPLPRWGNVNWDNFVWPIGQFALLIETVDNFKIMSKKINVKKDTITFYLREV